MGKLDRLINQASGKIEDFSRKIVNGNYTQNDSFEEFFKLLKMGFFSLVILGIGGYIVNYSITGEKDPRKWPQIFNERGVREREKEEYTKEINARYNSLFKNAKNLEDSIEIYYNNPELKRHIKLEKIDSIEIKEKIVIRTKRKEIQRQIQ